MFLQLKNVAEWRESARPIREKAVIAVLFPEIARVLPGAQTARVTAWNKKFIGNLC
jgi:hypothetical protein